MPSLKDLRNRIASVKATQKITKAMQMVAASKLRRAQAAAEAARPFATRMSAMDSATRNAGEMIKKQTMTYNRSRQAMITKELIEIISGAEAL